MPRIRRVRFLGTASAGATSYTLTVEAGTLTLSGQTVTLNRGYSLTVEAGALTLAGGTVGLARGFTLTVETGALTLAGQTVTMNVGRTLTVDAGTLTLAGQSVGMDLVTAGAYVLTVEPGALTLSGQSVGMTLGRVLTVEPGALTLAGGTVTMTYTPASTGATCDLLTCVLESTPFGDITVGDALRILLAAAAGKLNGADGATISIRDMMDSKNRIVATVDSSGNRTAITTLDGSI